jgi:hypothetical protein
MPVPQEKASRSCMDYGFHMAITRWDDKVCEHMKEQHEIMDWRNGAFG